jgi:hypothetical protein
MHHFLESTPEMGRGTPLRGAVTRSVVVLVVVHFIGRVAQLEMTPKSYVILTTSFVGLIVFFYI